MTVMRGQAGRPATVGLLIRDRRQLLLLSQGTIRALSGRLRFMDRRHKFNADSFIHSKVASYPN